MAYVDELQASNSRHAAIMKLRTAVSRDGKFARLSFRPETFGAYMDYLAASLHPLENGSARDI